MKFCMIDLETLALTNDAYILSCGAVMMDTGSSLEHQPYNHFSVKLPINQPGRVIDPSTVFWHMNKTSQATKDITFNEKRLIHMSSFITDFLDWYNRYMPDTVWSKGADFDIAILEHLFKSEKRKVPWNYKERSCYRTALEMAMRFEFLEKKILSIPGNTEENKSHSALSDAISQARTLWHIYNELEEKLNIPY